MYSPPIIVCGTGRSGTSIISGMLHYLGVNMGPDDKLIPANEHNPAGHWEDSRFKELNLLYLQDEISKEEFEENVQGLYNKMATTNRFWGWKVPSTATHLPKYLSLWADRQDTKPKIIFCRRELKDVKESMKDHYGWDDQYAEKLIKRRLEGIKEGLKEYDIELKVFQLEDVKEDSEGTVEELISFTGIKPYEDEIERAEELVVQDRPGSDTKIFVATPTMGKIRKEVVEWYMAWTQSDRYRRMIAMPTAIPYEKNVNKIIERFLDSDSDYLLLVDDDNPPVKDPFDLVELDKDIIGLPTPMWKGDNDKRKVTYNALDDVGKPYKPVPPEKQFGLREVDAMGSGCMLIARRVLEDFDGNWFSPKWNEKGTSRRSGDWNFCTKAKEKGWKVWTHFDYPCEHLHEIPLKKVDDNCEWKPANRN